MASLKGFCSALGLACVWCCGTAAQTNDFYGRLFEGQKLRNSDKFAEALKVHQALLKDVQKVSGEPRLTALVFDNVAVDQEDCGNYASAETAFNQGLAVLPPSSSYSDPVEANLKVHLSELYISENRPDDADGLLRQAREGLRQNSAESLALAIVDEDLAVVCIMRHKMIEPEALLRQSQALIEKQFGPGSTKSVSSLLTYAGYLIKQHRYDDALDPAEAAWKILSKSPTPLPKPFLASAQSVRSAVFYHAGRIPEAEDCARQAVELAKASLGPDHPRLGFFLANYAVILKNEGRRSEAKAIQKEADAIQDRNPAIGAGDTVNIASLR